ncbi:luciferin 4-monooxygenase-like [Bicyclus anynana]|uniref:Luciferin 4-monooxygenase-like n=1 Tax=Bicyclus anynana TaxID=110368 RepID=A0A6J1MUM7_BICAN|nr:luciferin 4-monooxygenase-like [Bicyclus anynana]
MGLEEEVPLNYHLGHLAFDNFRRHENIVFQIDAATGEEESYGSVLNRSIRLAQALRAFGLSPGDVVAISGPNHLDLCIPFYAALFNGLPIVGVDPYFKYEEVRALLKLTSPRIAFCQNESHDVYAKAAADLGLDVKLVTFDEGECTMQKFLEMYYRQGSEDDFEIADFDQEKIYAFLVSTSGTSGKVKFAAIKHRPVLLKQLWLKQLQYKSTSQERKESTKKILALSPVNWISKYVTLTMSTVEGLTLLQTSIPDNLDHVIDIINKYKPESTLFSPAMIACLLARKDEVDLTCFESISVAGSKIYLDVLTEFKKLLDKKCMIIEAYGQTEMLGPILAFSPFAPPGSCGVPVDMYSIKLVNPDTGEEIKEANVTGEIWAKGLSFSEYYKDPEETAQAFTEDGYFKTGDLLYRDQNNNYYFVDRIKMLIKYRNSHVLPTELEEVIQKHPGVKEVCVVGIDDPVDGQRPLACVVRQKGSDVTAQEIQELVASNLSSKKELRGGVIFCESLPYTSSEKLCRSKIKEMALRILNNS